MAFRIRAGAGWRRDVSESRSHGPESNRALDGLSLVGAAKLANNSPVSYSDANGLRSCGPDGVLCGYNSALGTRAQYQRERFVYRVLEPLRRSIRKITQKLRGVTKRPLKNGHSFTTVNRNGWVKYFIDDTIEIPPNIVDDPLEFAVQYAEAYDDEYGSRIDDPVTRTLRAMAIACDTGKPGCALSYRRCGGG
jgi:hypothetical protein